MPPYIWQIPQIRNCMHHNPTAFPISEKTIPAAPQYGIAYRLVKLAIDPFLYVQILTPKSFWKNFPRTPSKRVPTSAEKINSVRYGMPFCVNNNARIPHIGKETRLIFFPMVNR